MNKLFKSVVSVVTAASMTLSVVGSLALTAGAAEDKGAIMPTYEGTIAALEKANDYYQSRVKYNQEEYSDPLCFWEKGAYHTGNMEAYYATGIEAYRQYSTNWANACGWKGHPSTNKEAWTWDYWQELDRHAVLFGDFQICFQTFIDLYNVERNETKGAVADNNKIARALEVMSYQVDKGNDDFWWWADGLYMVMPVMTKLYQVTGDEKYLDGLYRFWRFAKELMYDGPGGIPTSADGYTTSANRKKANGSAFSDPNNYTYLFYRDGGYAYPLKPNPGHENEKNFWARGDGWVFAGLARILQDLPDNWEHYNEFEKTYLEMAPAIKACMRTDENGYGFWTQSMLQGYPTSAENPNGYETSGTAFFTYGFAWGINSGLLPREEYLETAVRAWNYLENIALQPDGLVGYVQYIGSNATKAMGPRDNQNFGLGAYLLAASEISRLVGGNQGDMYPYLQKKMNGYMALRVDTPHYYKDGKIGHIEENDHTVEVYLKADDTGHSTSMMPARLIVEKFGGTVEFNGATNQVTAKIGDRTVVFTVGSNVITVNGVQSIAPTAPEIKNSRTFVPLRALAESLGKEVYWNNGLIVVGPKAKPFYSCDTNIVNMMLTMLGKPETYPTRPKQPEKDFVPKVPTLADANRIQAEKIEASEEPEANHSAYNASDGRMDEESRYVGNSQGCNITFTYKEPVDVGQVALTFWKTATRTTKFKLEYTTDGTSWKQVFNGATTLNKTSEIFDINTKVKAFKIYGYGNSEGSNWFSLIEFAVYKPGVKAGEATSTTVVDSTTVTATDKPVGTKIALNQNMLTPSDTPQSENHKGNLLDGNNGTVWAAQGAQNLVIALANTTPITTVGVQFKLYEDDRTIPFSVQVSNDKATWTNVYSGKSVAFSANTIYIPVNKEAKFVKINVEGHAVSGWTSMAEVEVYTGTVDAAANAGTTTTTTATVEVTPTDKATGTKVALNQNMLTVSATPQSENHKGNLLDGNNGTVWASEGLHNLVVSLGKATNISCVGVQFKLYDDDRYIPYSVEVSNDNATWTKIYSGQSVPFSGATIYIPVNKEAKFVRVNVEGNNKSNWTSMAEIEVYSK